MDRTIEKVLSTEYSQEFDDKRKVRMVIGFHEYGPVKANTENGFIKAIDSAENCIELYKKTGNLKYVIDLANFAMMEYMFPQHPKAHLDGGDTVKSATVKKSCIRDIENASRGYTI